jgi:hypothetical protein
VRDCAVTSVLSLTLVAVHHIVSGQRTQSRSEGQNPNVQASTNKNPKPGIFVGPTLYTGF